MRTGVLEDVDQCRSNLDYLTRIRAFALESLGPMYDKKTGMFHFRVKKNRDGVIPEGISRRYTAITLIGLSGEDDGSVRNVLSGESAQTVYGRLLDGCSADANVGDAALTIWAGLALGHDGARRAVPRLRALRPESGPQFTVELSWALIALSGTGHPEDADLAENIAKRLLDSIHPSSNVFPHVVGEAHNTGRSHVSCFADLVYPVQALSIYAKASGKREYMEPAVRCAEHFCRLQGNDGQWWWHYDWRTGSVLEGYPVYAVHQDAMAPMALFALKESGGRDFRREISLGLEWLRKSPEIEGGTLVDEKAGFIWRKVARKEPGKATRYLQAACSLIHPGLRVPGADFIFPPRIIDYEDRPYHIGWLLHAWSKSRIAEWGNLQ